MKIKEINLQRYGPLTSIQYRLEPPLVVLYGENERGKTLTIDALMKLLLGKKGVRKFTNIHRVEEEPEGYLLVNSSEKDNFRELKIPERGRLPELTGLTPQDYEKVFCIRQSRLHLEEESEFFTTITERITGLRSREIEQVVEKLRNQAQITPSGAFSNVQGVKLKARLEEAQKYLKQVEELEEIAQAKGYDKLEETLVKSREELELARKMLQDQENAQQRELYQKNLRALEELKKALERYQQLENFTSDEEQQWRDLEKEQERLLQEKTKKEKEMQEFKEQLIALVDEVRKLSKEAEVWEKRKKTWDEEISPLLKQCEKKFQEKAQQEEKFRLFKVPAFIFSALLGISLINVLANPAWPSYLLSGILVLVSLGFWKPGISLARISAQSEQALEEIKQKMAAQGREIAGGLTEVLQESEKWQEDYQKKMREWRELQARQQIIETKLDELQNQVLRELDDQIQENQEKQEAMKRKAEVKDREEYSQKLQEKVQLERTIGEREKILENSWRPPSNDQKNKIAYWEKRLQELSPYGDAAPETTYQHQDMVRIKEEIQQLEKKEQELQQTIQEYQKQLGDIENSVNLLLAENQEGPILCRSTVDLQALKEKLQQFRRTHLEQKEAAETAISIFQEIQQEEKVKVGELFGKDSEISRLFQEITGGIYREASFHQEKEKILVKLHDDTWLDADQLSGGAFDQLYFSVRLALGEKLLQGEKGFFILDDPFIKSDFKRLQKQMEILKKMAAKGWQVLYFTAKKEVREALEKDIQEGSIQWQELASKP